MIGAAFLLVMFGYATIAVTARRQAAPASTARAVAGLHVLVACGVAAYRGDLPPAGWSSALTLAGAIPAIALLAWPAVATTLAGPLAVWSAACVGFAAAPQGLGVVHWVPWSIPHIALSIIAVGTLITAAGAAAIRLRGRAVGLLAVALLLVSVPLVSPRADSVFTFDDGAPIELEVHIGDLQGDPGIVRTVFARTPVNPWPRRVGALLLLISLFVAGAAAHAGRSMPSALRWVGVAGAAAPVVGLLAAWLPGDLANLTEISQVARDTITLELSGSQTIRAVHAPAATFGGGFGATAATLVFPLIALGLALLTLGSQEDHATAEVTARLEHRGATLAALLMAGAVLTGMIWANFSWGGVAYPDPKLFAGIVSLILLGAWHVADAELPKHSGLPSWLVIGALLVTLWSVLGPTLGWIAPTLHDFGP